MKLGCCLNMNASGEPNTGAEDIPVLAEQGYDYIELPLTQVMELTDTGFKDLLRRIGESGIPLEACNNFMPPTFRLTGENARPEEALEYVKAAAERAAAMGAKVLVMGSAGAKNIPPGFPYDRARSQLLAFLRKLPDIVRPLGITVVLEPLNTKESNFVITTGEALALVREVDLENLKMLIDYYHLRMENEDVSVVSGAGPYLRHIHLAAKEGRLFPKPGDGEDNAGYFKQLKAAGYAGGVSVEA
jgi:sugar phosphate isomerase/epimerase